MNWLPSGQAAVGVKTTLLRLSHVKPPGCAGVMTMGAVFDAKPMSSREIMGRAKRNSSVLDGCRNSPSEIQPPPAQHPS